MPGDRPLLTRDLPVVARCSALLVIDVQNYCCRRDGGMLRDRAPAIVERDFGYYLRRLHEVVVPNLGRLITACREARMEVIYTTIEALTADGRDQSLDYKISGLLVPKGAWEGRVIDEIAPVGDEIHLPKTASSVFNATNIEYVLRNLGIERLAITGVLTDQCVESAVRDACDRGFLVTVVEDACATLSAARHRHSLAAIRGYCRRATTAKVVAEIQRPTRSPEP